MNLLQITEPGRAEWRDAPMPEPRAGEVLLKVSAVSTCPHWDLHILGGEPMFADRPLEYPYVPGEPGHEAVGHIAALGDGVTGLEVGQRVATWRDPGGRRQGCYAEYVAVDAEQVLAVPDRLADADLAPLGLAMCVQVSFAQLMSRGSLEGKRVGIAQALLHDPPVLILDEPTSGLDPQQTLAFRELIQELRGQHTIMLSSHILPEVERSADRVIIISGGVIAAQGTPAELRERASQGGAVLVEAKATPEQMTHTLQAISKVRGVKTQRDGDWCRAVIESKDETDLRVPVAEALSGKGYTIREMHLDAPTLERYFVEAVAKGRA